MPNYRLLTSPAFNRFLQDLPPAAQDEVCHLLEIIEQGGDLADQISVWPLPSGNVFVLHGVRAWVTFDVEGQDIRLIACAREQTWSPTM